MVFESIVTDVLNKSLGEYVENLDSSQLKIGIWGGDVVLTNLVLKQSALDDLNLPVKTVFGILGKLVLKIPWKNLYSSPTEASIEKLFLLVVPNQEIKYDPVKEEKWKQDAKQAEIEKVEAAKKRELEKDQPKADDTFAEKLVAQMVRNVQISIKDIHIRYEDRISNPSSPFSLGITLHNLTVITTDKNWLPAISQTGYIFKHLTIEGLSLYWNSNCQLFGASSSEDTLQNLFQAGIPSKQQLIEGYKYMFGPINCTAKLQLNMKPEADNYSIPKALLTLQIDNVFLRISKSQYSDIMALLESLDRMSRASMYRKYRPDVQEYKGNYKAWWKYAYTCILEEEVRRKRRNWDWLHILSHRQLCREYADLYQSKLVSKTKVPVATLNNCEKKLDAFNIVLIRKKIEMEVERAGQKALQEAKPQKGWFSWWGSSTESDSKTDIKKQFQEAMTKAEKEKLFQAIGYQENASFIGFPREFVAVKVEFSLDSLIVEVRDDATIKPEVMVVSLKQVTLDCAQRPTDNGIMVRATMHRVTVTGLEQHGVFPKMCDCLDDQLGEDMPLTEVMVETNPLDNLCDTHVEVVFRPLRIVYDAQTINKLVDIFTPEEDKSALVYQLQMAANMKLAEMKEKSALGLQYTIQKHARLRLKINVMASHIILPHTGFYDKDQPVLVYNLGKLTVESKARESLQCIKTLYQTGITEDEILEKMIAESYDKFHVKIENMQIIIARPGEDWMTCFKNYINSELHLLHPTSLIIVIHKCLISDDPRLPNIKISGTLPNITLKIRESRLFDTLSLLLSIPFSEKKSKSSALEDLYSTVTIYGSSSSIFRADRDLVDKTKFSTKKSIHRGVYGQDEELVQFTDVDSKFLLNEIIIEIIADKEMGGIKPFLTLKVMKLEANMTMQTYNMSVELFLGGLSFTQIYEQHTVKMINTPMASGENDYLFVLKYLHVDKNSPDFHSHHKSVVQLIDVNFSKFNVLVHQEALLSVIHWVNNMQVLLTEAEKGKEPVRSASKEETKLSQPHRSLLKETSSKLVSAAKKLKKKPVETVDMKLKARVGEVGITLANKDYKLARMELKGAVGRVLLKRSYTQIDAKLTDLQVIDFKNSVHPKIVSIVGTQELITLQVVLFNEELMRKTDSVNMSITATMGCVRVVFLNRFHTSLMNFMNNFQVAQDAIIEASTAAAEAAKVNMQQAYSAALKVRLNINLHAPIVIIPVDSQSFDAVLVDFGNLTIVNSFQDITVGEQLNYTAVLDLIQLTLDNVTVSRIVVEGESFKSLKNLLEPISFQLLVQRNLSASWFTNVPDLDVSGHFKTIEIKLHRDDYYMVMTVLRKNFGEVDLAIDDVRSLESSKSFKMQSTIASHQMQRPPITYSAMSTITEEDSNDPSVELPLIRNPAVTHTEVTTVMKFTFRLESLIIELSQSEINRNSSGKVTTTKEYSLAKLELYLLSLKGAILSDGTYTASALLLDFLIDDTRPSQEHKINRYMERLPFAQSDVVGEGREVPHKSMIDVTFRMKDNSLFVDFRVFSFVLILNLQHLLKLAEFFTVDSPEVQVTKQTASSTSYASRLSAEISPGPIKKAVESVSSLKVINLCIEKPDIILVESLDDITTNALILEMETVLKIRLVDDTQQVVTGTVTNLQVFTCCYDPAKRQDTKSPVLHPVSISLAGSTPNRLGLHLDLCTTHIHLSVTPGTIELLNKCYSALYSNLSQTGDDEGETDDYSDVWEVSRLNEIHYWFLKSEVAREALDLVSGDFNIENENQETTTTPELSEICLVSVPSIVITLEAGIGNHTLPMLLLESSVKGNVQNWSSQLTAEMQVTLQIGYYNSSLAAWEPFIEPISVTKQGVTQLHPWELTLKMEKQDPAIKEGPQEAEDTVDGTHKPSLMTVAVTSEETMEITVTKTCLEVLQSLGTSFNDAIYKPETYKKTDRAPYIIQNDTGLDIIVLLNQMPFQMYKPQTLEEITKVLAEPGAEVSLCSIGEEETSLTSLMLRSSSSTNVTEKYLVVQVKDTDCVLEIPITRAEKRYFVVKPKTDSNEQQGIISDISVDGGSIIITLCSIIRVYNHFRDEVSVYFMTKKGNEVQLVDKILPESHLNLPVQAIYTPTNELFFSVPGYTVSLRPFVWKELQKTLSMMKLLQCNSKNVEDSEPFFIQAVGEMEQVFFELSNHYTMASTCYNIHLRPTVVLKNFLPVEILVCIQGLASEKKLSSGEHIEIPTAEPGSSSIVIRISGYLDKDWSCKRSISENPPELEVWTFESYDAPQRITFDLGMHSVNRHGSLVLALYCPFWMLNKTGLSLCYRQSDDLSNILYHPEDFKVPVMFSFRAKSFFGKKKACIKVQNGEWSDKFSLDVAGSFGVVNCKVKDETYQIGVHIDLTYNTLTKQVTFTPYHILVNHCSRLISCCEAINNSRWIKVEAGSCEPFYPVDSDRSMVVRIRGTTEESVQFPYDKIHTSLLKLDNKYGGINVDVHMTEGAVYISFNDFKEELAPALLMNHTSRDIEICEKYSDIKFKLPPLSKKLFSWSAVRDHKQITWIDEKFSNDLYKDDIGEFIFPDGIKAYYVSFLDGMQRVFLLTPDISVAKTAHNAGDTELFDQEIDVSIHGISLSLVDNINQREILYLEIASSGIIWETSAKSTKRYKHLPDAQSSTIEEVYQSYLQEKQLGKDEPIRQLPDRTEVDFVRKMITKPQMKCLRRTYNTGFWLKMKSSRHQLQLHAKVNKLQIDDQMYDCVFPVVLAPVPPPKSVTASNVVKPFGEVSIVQRLNEHSSVKQYKYFKILIQEFHIKLDIGFINAIANFFEAGDISDDLEASQFAIDRKLVHKQLLDYVAVLSSQQQKNFYDFLHFSPLKIHLSFSLSGGGGSNGITGLPPVLSILTQSLGVTLTDMQDVVFKLSYFERQYTFLSQHQLMNEVQMHYAGQFFKQVYVLVFGLDVLGNPYGLVVGFKQGVEDLFYEPFQGAIQGPGEFAEGFYLGVRSLFGHTIGGAAGAVSRITGAMGKGLAALTFDEEYQKKRREQLHTAQSTGVPESMAQSGKGLVMGVVHGVGGVFSKPFSGAKEEGVEGFFKGFGKGMVGLVTRPTAGVVDFASDTFSSVRRIAQMSEEVSRMRNPRQFKIDRLIRPYSKLEAEGQKLLMEVDKGKLQATDAYVYHVTIGQKDILLLTDQRIAYLSRNDVFGGYQIDWAHTWTELLEPPKGVDNGIVISVSHSKKKLFKSSSTKKLLLINDSAQRQIILLKIQQCMSPSAGRGGSTGSTFLSLARRDSSLL